MAETLRKGTKVKWTPPTQPGLRTEIGHTNIVQICISTFDFLIPFFSQAR